MSGREPVSAEEYEATMEVLDAYCLDAGVKSRRREAHEETVAALAAGKAICCPVCWQVSHNPNDVAQRYCGACHAFLDDMPEVKR